MTSIREAFVGWLFSMASSANKKANSPKLLRSKITIAGYPGQIPRSSLVAENLFS